MRSGLKPRVPGKGAKPAPETPEGRRRLGVFSLEYWSRPSGTWVIGTRRWTRFSRYGRLPGFQALGMAGVAALPGSECDPRRRRALREMIFIPIFGSGWFKSRRLLDSVTGGPSSENVWCEMSRFCFRGHRSLESLAWILNAEHPGPPPSPRTGRRPGVVDRMQGVGRLPGPGSPDSPFRGFLTLCLWPFPSPLLFVIDGWRPGYFLRGRNWTILSTGTGGSGSESRRGHSQ